MSIETKETLGLPTLLPSQTRIERGFVVVPAYPTSYYKGSKTIKLYYEIHGTRKVNASTKRIVGVCGLNNNCFVQLRQVEHFGKQENTQYLVFDNRGCGYSDAPWGFYTTNILAHDCIGLLDYLGWNDHRSIHVIGHSMGGMIAQKIASLAPERIASLMLASTAAVGHKSISIKSFMLFGQLVYAEAFLSPQDMIRVALQYLFPYEWLEGADPVSPGQKRRPTMEKCLAMGIAIGKPQRFSGQLGQTTAAISHYLSASSLEAIGTAISPSPIGIISGNRDEIVNLSNSCELSEALGGSLRVVDGGGHAIGLQEDELYNSWMEEVIKQAC